MEPLKLREDVDRMVLLYSNQGSTNTSLKFRFNGTISDTIHTGSTDAGLEGDNDGTTGVGRGRL